MLATVATQAALNSRSTGGRFKVLLLTPEFFDEGVQEQIMKMMIPETNQAGDRISGVWLKII